MPGAENDTAHSLYSGGATVADAAGVPVSTLARHNPWKESSPVVLGYVWAGEEKGNTNQPRGPLSAESCGVSGRGRGGVAASIAACSARWRAVWVS